MAGYQRSTLKLVFEDPQFEGLEVRMKRLSVGQLFTVTELADLDKGDAGRMHEQFQQLTDMVGQALISWNLEEAATGSDLDGDPVPVPATPEGLRGQDVEFVMGIVAAWTDAATAVTPPLSRRSNSGQPSPEPFDLTAALSESLPS